MGQLHGDDFVRVRPFGKLGDKACDGYLNSSGQVFQCYGAMNGETKQVAKPTKKMTDDFGTAAAKLAAIMREWHMVLNLIEGVPTDNEDNDHKNCRNCLHGHLSPESQSLRRNAGLNGAASGSPMKIP